MNRFFVAFREAYPKIEEYCSIDIHGYLFHSVCDVEPFILAEFGEGWSKPDSNYVYNSSPSNLIRFRAYKPGEYESTHKTNVPCMQRLR